MNLSARFSAYPSGDLVKQGLRFLRTSLIGQLIYWNPAPNSLKMSMMTPTMNKTLTDIPGIRVGHAQDFEALTGCTVILCPPRTIGGVDQRGGGPGTRETDLLRPMHLVQYVNAIMLAGGSAFGLAAADGIMRYL